MTDIKAFIKTKIQSQLHTC